MAKKTPKSLTEKEQRRLLATTKEDGGLGFRDYVIYSLAIGAGLRQHEIAALNVGDVFDPPVSGRNIGKPKRLVTLSDFKGSENATAAKRDAQEVHIPDAVISRLREFWKWKRTNDEPLEPESCLFCASFRTDKEGNPKRITCRTLLHSFSVWQQKARFDRHLKFHALRHTCGMNLYRATKDIRVVQRQLRHADINTTTIYATPSDDDLSRAVRGLNV